MNEFSRHKTETDISQRVESPRQGWEYWVIFYLLPEVSSHFSSPRGILGKGLPTTTYFVIPIDAVKTRRAAVLLPLGFVGLLLTARCADARNNPPRPMLKSPAAASLAIFRQSLRIKTDSKMVLAHHYGTGTI